MVITHPVHPPPPPPQGPTGVNSKERIKFTSPIYKDPARNAGYLHGEGAPGRLASCPCSPLPQPAMQAAVFFSRPCLCRSAAALLPHIDMP